MTASAPAKETILVVDDEASIRRILETRLSMIGYQVITACDGVEALDAFRRTSPDLVVLDVMMPKLDGYGVCQELRKESDVPIVMLTALGDVADRITGLELGADDYVVKPFSPKELEARIRCVLRRVDKDQAAGIPNSGVIQVSDLKIDTNKRQVYRGDERIRLTGMEFSLLELLVGRSGEPFSRGEILKEVWGYTPERHVDTRVVDVHISRLRSKLEDDPANPELILTARGTGYLFQRIIEALAQKDTDISGRSPKRRRPQAIRRLVIWYRRNAAVTSLVDTASAASSVAGSMAGSVAGSVVSTAGSVAGAAGTMAGTVAGAAGAAGSVAGSMANSVLQPLVFDPLRRLQQGTTPGSDQPIVDSERLWVAVDGMGGDYAPGPILEGCLRAVALLPVRVRFVAETAAVDQAVAALGLGEELAAAIDAGLIDVVASGPSVGMNEEATVVRRKRDASINMAMDLVKAGEATAVYSAGNSGAVMASAIFRLGRLKGIDRPAIGALFPTKDPNQQVLVLDVGANMDAKAAYLHQFALLGNIYSRDVLQVPRPRIGLLNIGEEECKGNELCLKTYPLLAADDRFVFAGNCEGRDVLSGDFDVVVCDGFTGNVLLKFLESVGSVLLDVLRAELPRGRRGKVGSAFLRSNLVRIKKRLDHAEHGGALLLGVNGVCVIGHGSSKALSVVSALRLAHSAASHGVMDDLHKLSDSTDAVVACG